MNFSFFSKEVLLKTFDGNSFETFLKFGSSLEDLSFCDFVITITLEILLFFLLLRRILLLWNYPFSF